MTDYRNFIRFGTFDGITPEDAVYTQLGFTLTTTATDAAGVWSPTALKRTNGAVSLVRAAFDTVAPGDVVQVTTEGGAVRFQVPASLTGDWLFLYPRDNLVLNAPGGRTVNVLVNDLTDDQLNSSLLALVQLQLGVFTAAPTQQTQLIAALPATMTAVPPPTPGPYHIVVFVSNPISGDLTLVPPSALPLDSRVTFIKTGAGNVGLVVDDPAVDQVNGFTNTNGDTRYTLRADGESVTYTVVANGWQRPQGSGPPPMQVALVTPFQIVGAFEGFTFVQSEMVVAGDDLLLPPPTEIRTGFAVVGRNVSLVAHDLVAAPTTVNSFPSVSIPAGTTFVAFFNGVEWTAIISS